MLGMPAEGVRMRIAPNTLPPWMGSSGTELSRVSAGPKMLSSSALPKRANTVASVLR